MDLQVFEFSSKSKGMIFIGLNLYFVIKYIQNPKPYSQIFIDELYASHFSYIALALHKGCIINNATFL
jgi:hypothetical protein